MIKVLIITDRLKYACGVTSYVYNLIKYSDAKKVKFILLAAPGDRESDFKSLGIKVIINEKLTYEKKGLLNTFFDFLLILKISYKFKIDVIHSQNYYLANISRIVQKVIKLKTVQTQNNNFPQGRLPQFSADNFIVVNKDMKDTAIHIYGIKEKRIHEIRYGVPLNMQYSKVQSNNFKIIVASRLIPEKGVDIFIKAINLLDKDLRANCEFIIAGNGSQEKYLIELDNRLNTQIKFLGIVRNIQELLGQSHIFVIPSYWDMEGFPITIIEAALSLNLIIASNFRGLNSYFHHNVDGFVFEKKDINGLKTLLEDAIKGYDKYQYIIKSAYLKFSHLFSIESMIKQTLEVYKIR